jgi:hypothetical protein
MSAANETQYKTSENLAARADMFKRFGAGPSAWHGWVFDHRRSCHGCMHRRHRREVIAAQGELPIRTQSGIFVARK